MLQCRNLSKIITMRKMIRLYSQNNKFQITKIKSTLNMHDLLGRSKQTNLKKILNQLNLRFQSKLSQKQNLKKLIDFLIQQSKTAQINYEYSRRMVSMVDQFNIIELFLDQFVQLQQFGPKEQQIIHNFFFYWGSMYKLITEVHYKILNKKNLLNFIKRFSQYLYLVKRTKQISHIYIKLIFHFEIQFNQNISTLFTSYVRVALECMIESKLVNDQVSHLLYVCSKFGIYTLHYQKAIQIVVKLTQMLDPLWFESQKISITVAKSLVKLGIRNKKIEDGLNSLFQNKTNFKKIVIGLTSLLQLRILRVQNLSKEHIQIIKELVKTFKSNFKELQEILTRFFYRSGIWIQQYWLSFFQYVESCEIHQHLKYDLFVIGNLLEIEKDIIPQSVQIAAKSTLKILESKGNYYNDFDMLKSYDKIYGKKNILKNASQHMLANSLRLAHQVQVKNQYRISIFMVDILLNNKYVVEVNNQSHYIKNLDTGQNYLDLKSGFRERILKKLGYKLMWIEIVQFNEPSFQFIKKVNDFIKQQ